MRQTHVVLVAACFFAIQLCQETLEEFGFACLRIPKIYNFALAAAALSLLKQRAHTLRRNEIRGLS